MEEHQFVGAGNLAWHLLGGNQTLKQSCGFFYFPPLQITEWVRVEEMEEMLTLFKILKKKTILDDQEIE